MTDKQSLCIDILVGGYVNSFVDFFYLTHRAEEDATAAAAAANGGSGASASSSSTAHPPPIPDSKLSTIQHHLTSAERAHRRGDSEQVYASYEALAHDFHAAQDYKTSIYFYEVSRAAGPSIPQCSSAVDVSRALREVGSSGTILFAGKRTFLVILLLTLCTYVFCHFSFVLLL